MVAAALIAVDVAVPRRAGDRADLRAGVRRLAAADPAVLGAAAAVVGAGLDSLQRF